MCWVYIFIKIPSCLPSLNFQSPELKCLLWGLWPAQGKGPEDSGIDSVCVRGLSKRKKKKMSQSDHSTVNSIVRKSHMWVQKSYLVCVLFFSFIIKKKNVNSPIKEWLTYGKMHKFKVKNLLCVYCSEDIAMVRLMSTAIPLKIFLCLCVIFSPFPFSIYSFPQAITHLLSVIID